MKGLTRLKYPQAKLLSKKKIQAYIFRGSPALIQKPQDFQRLNKNGKTHPKDGGKEGSGDADAREVTPAWLALISGGCSSIFNADSSTELGERG